MFKIGCMVKIKSWEKLTKENTINEDGDILLYNSNDYFFKEDRQLCGQVCVIEKNISRLWKGYIKIKVLKTGVIKIRPWQILEHYTINPLFKTFKERRN